MIRRVDDLVVERVQYFEAAFEIAVEERNMEWRNSLGLVELRVQHRMLQ